MLRIRKWKKVSGAGIYSLRSSSSHYDVLGVTPKATQSDIKTAYYNLSKIHHPDISTDETSAKKFRAITEAYEVLGNIRLKKMYDKGLIVGKSSTSRMTPEEEPEPTDPSLRFHKSRSQRHIIPTIDGRTPIYNFDAWAKNHYSALYEKSQYDKDFIQKTRAKRQAARESHRQETVMAIMLLLCSVFVMLVINGTEDFDQDRLSKDNTNGEQQIKPEDNINKTE